MATHYRIERADTGTVLARCDHASEAVICAVALAVRARVVVCWRSDGREIRRWPVPRGASNNDVRKAMGA